MKHSLLTALACTGILTLATSGAAATARPAAAAANETAARTEAAACDSKPPGQPVATGLSTIEQAYDCIFTAFYGRGRLDHRMVLAAGLAGLTEELNRRGTDRPDATMPPLTGNRTTDLGAFAAVYERVMAGLPADAALRQAAAGATIKGMVGSLHDNHSQWRRRAQLPGKPGDVYGLGFTTSPGYSITYRAPQKAVAPLFVNAVQGGPATAARIRPGEIVQSVNGAPVFVNGVLSSGAMNLLNPEYSGDRPDPVRLALLDPSTGRVRKATLRPRVFAPTTRPVTARRLDGDVAAIKLANFQPGTADQVLAAIAGLREDKKLRGVILDLRGTNGGSPAEVVKLLSSFVHGKVHSYDCAPDDTCTPNRTDDAVPLLGLPLTVLTDGICASACDAFSAAVKDLKVGPLIGSRTSGMVSGSARMFALDDGSTLSLPAAYQVGADHELINGIGVAPDHYLPMTAKNLREGRDPAMAKALSLLPPTR
ncbi:S41 family peptidase [Nonomuraea sp. NPDC050153]|uniref:S41 family peptidase n=1 Tax=Nonomuraea sp. NPDC050153 TaxID=3364359 RepID=UPI0037AC90B6